MLNLYGRQMFVPIGAAMPKLHRSFLLISCCIGAATFSHAAVAGPMLDQSDTVYGGSTVASAIGQSFTAGLSGLLASVFIGSSAASLSAGSDTVGIYRGDGISAASLLNSAAFTPTKTSTGYSFDVSSLLVSLLAGQQYTFNVTAALGQVLYVNGDSTSSYTRGSVYYGGAPYGYDLDFATYVTPASAASVTPTSPAVPEPSSLAILGAGLVGLLVVRRRWFT